MSQIQTKFIANAAITIAKLATITDGVTLNQLGTGTSLQVAAGGISNAQINASASISYSKLNLANSIQASDQNSAAATSMQFLVANGTGGAAYRSIVTGDLPTVAIAQGGTGQVTAAAAFNALSPMTTTGDIEYEVSANTAARLPIGTTGQILTVVSGAPAWAAAATGATTTKETHVLTGTDITNQFITLSFTPIANSTDLLVQGAGVQLEGSSYDYTISTNTLVFQNGLATGGASALVSGDILQVQYQH